jgi:hypothetical protein
MNKMKEEVILRILAQESLDSENRLETNLHLHLIKIPPFKLILIVEIRCSFIN